ncbi:hypothetical protein AB6N24_08650 [Cellulomonas sp. 179-A 4D5 NHS]|uniref:hypothetical protein n=1 Tax=Cellulomonas sp. 179-A 4D5 NHS TaxID=3142378 RepID=UPI00399F2F26
MSTQGQTYYEYVLAELAREHERRSSAQSRASSLGSFGSGAVALATAALTLSLGNDYRVSAWGSALLALALGAFLASTVMAVHVFAVGQRYEVSNEWTLRELLTSHWTDSEPAARNHVASAAVSTLIALRSGNNGGADRLAVAGYLQAGGLGLLTAVVVVEYAHMLSQ